MGSAVCKYFDLTQLPHMTLRSYHTKISPDLGDEPVFLENSIILFCFGILLQFTGTLKRFPYNYFMVRFKIYPELPFLWQSSPFSAYFMAKNYMGNFLAFP